MMSKTLKICYHRFLNGLGFRSNLIPFPTKSDNYYVLLSKSRVLSLNKTERLEYNIFLKNYFIGD